MMVKCYQCGIEFEPEPQRLKEWAESGKNFEPTDWECPNCEGEYQFCYRTGCHEPISEYVLLRAGAVGLCQTHAQENSDDILR